MELDGGIDLHSSNSVAFVLDEKDEMVGRSRLPNDMKRVAGWLEPYREESVGVVVELTYNWRWLADGLADLGYSDAPGQYGRDAAIQRPRVSR